MQALTEVKQSVTAQRFYLASSRSLKVEKLSEHDREEVLQFLGKRPIHTFGMAGFIRDNGLVSPHNRGTFYACRDEEGRLEGIALIGHFILFETGNEAAIAAFAGVAQQCPDAYLLLGEQESVQAFWKYYAPQGQ